MLIQTSTMTQKGQVTIPLFIRQKLAFAPGEKVSFFLDENRVGLRKVADFFSFRGSIKSPLKYDREKIKAAVGEYLARRYGQTSRR